MFYYCPLHTLQSLAKIKVEDDGSYIQLAEVGRAFHLMRVCWVTVYSIFKLIV